MTEEIFLVIKYSRGEQKCDYDDEENPHYYMEWGSTIIRRLVSPENLVKEIDKHNDGDYDFTSQVLFVVDDKDNILVDYTAPRGYTQESIYMAEDRKEAYFQKLQAERKCWNRAREHEIKRLLDSVWQEVQ